jgi:hypothetical protein
MGVRRGGSPFCFAGYGVNFLHSQIGRYEALRENSPAKHVLKRDM